MTRVKKKKKKGGCLDVAAGLEGQALESLDPLLAPAECVTFTSRALLLSIQVLRRPLSLKLSDAKVYEP